MIRILAKIWAKTSYIFSFEAQAQKSELSAALASKNAQEKRDLIEQLNTDADTMEDRIKHMAEMEEKGFWECENGHELYLGNEAVENEAGTPVHCAQCDKEMKLVKRSLMTGQEKYESDQDRKEAEKLAAAKRQQAEEESKAVSEAEKTAQYFRNMAANARSTADKIRHL
jgi:hypothetical protein